MTEQEREFYKKQLKHVKVIPASAIEQTAAFHLCPAEPQRQYHSYPEFVSNCSVCHTPVYFIDPRPHLDKICPQCAMKRNPDGMNSLATPDSLVKFILSGTRN